MEYLCSPLAIETVGQPNQTTTTTTARLDSFSSLTDCSFSFFQLLFNCLFIYFVSLLLLYRIVRRAAGARRRAHTARSRCAPAGGDKWTPRAGAPDDARFLSTKSASPSRRTRNSKSCCSAVSDNVFEPQLRTISESESTAKNNKLHPHAHLHAGGAPQFAVPSPPPTPTSPTPTPTLTTTTTKTLRGDNNYEVEYVFEEGDEDDPEFLRGIGAGVGPGGVSRPKDRSRQLLLHHNAIWIGTLLFVLLVAAQFAETVIVLLTPAIWRHPLKGGGGNVTVSESASDPLGPSPAPVILYLRLFSALSTLTALFWTLLLFQHAETRRAIPLLWVNIIYYVGATTFGGAHLLFYFYTLHLGWEHLKIGVHLGAFTAGLTLIVLVIHTFLRERRILKSGTDASLLNVKYLHYHTSLLSRLVFFWFTHILRIGYARPLEGEDLGVLPPEEKTVHQYERFNKVYEAERAHARPPEFSLWKCLFKTLGSSLAISGLFRLLADLTGFVAPLGIRTIVRYVGSNATEPPTPMPFGDHRHPQPFHMTTLDVFSNGYVMAFVILLSAILQSTFSQCSTFLVNSEGIHIKVALQALIYRKSLTLSPTKSSAVSAEDEEGGGGSSGGGGGGRARARRKSSAASGNHNNHNHKGGGGGEGEANSLHSNGGGGAGGGSQFDTGSILNILSEDTNNIMMFFWMVNFIWAIPLKLSILMGLLYLQLGFSALIGAGICILIMIPLQFYLGKKMSANSKQLMEKCDERLRSMSEILQGMKLLKLQGWELLFGQQITAIREKELKTLDRDLLYRSIMTFLTHISGVLVTVVTFGLYSYIETERLEPSKVFAGLALFNQLTVPLFIFPITVPVVIDALVSARRVREFLLAPEAVSYTTCEEGGTPPPLTPARAPDTPNPEEGVLQRPSLRRSTIKKKRRPPSLTIDVVDHAHAHAHTTSGGRPTHAPPPTPPHSAKSLKLPKGSDNIDASSDSVFAPIAEEGEGEGEDDSEEEEEDGGEEAGEGDGGDETDGDSGDGSLPPSAVDIDAIFDIQDEIEPIPIRAPSKFEKQKSVSVSMETPKTPMGTAEETKTGVNDLDLQIDLQFIDSEDDDDDDGGALISIKDGEFSWETDRADLSLSGINVSIAPTTLTILVGKTGSGKSSLVSALLGEMRKVGGEVRWGHQRARGARIAYAAQKPWILNGTVRENILFGKPFKPRRYKKVIDACSLGPDIDLLPAKEWTEIGEKGLNLSGGQKQRIAIARALYSSADVVILDDPLSALDVEVAHHVFHYGVRKFLLRSPRPRTVILVTHHLPILPHAHQIIALEKGRIRCVGTYKGIETSDPALFADWKRIMSKKKEELANKKGGKTAKERWSLVKNVHKVVAASSAAAAAAAKPKMASSVSWSTDEEKKWERYKKKKEIFSHHKTLSHEYRPGDECYYEEIMEPLLCHHRQTSRNSKESRASTSSYSKTHPSLSRMTSLQVETKVGGGRLPGVGVGGGAKDKIQRLQSLPVDEEPMPVGFGGLRARSGTNDSAMSIFNAKMKRKFFAKKQVSSTGSSSQTEMEKIQPQISQRLLSTLSADTEELPEDDDEEGEDDALLSNRESSTDEREYGFIPPRVYLTYITACGRSLSVFYVLVAIGYEVVHVYTNFWLKEWSDEVGRSPDYQYDDIMAHYFLVYVLLSVITVLVSLTANIVGKAGGANSRRRLHSAMFNTIIRCPVSFFEATPIGRVLNRFASDLAVVDRKLCVSMQRFLQFVFLCISAIVVNALVNPWFLIVAAPIVLVYYALQRFYRFSSRELHRIEAISRGPIFSHFHETLEGLSTIRAYGVQRRFTGQMTTTIDSNCTAASFINVGNRWLSISLDYLGSVIVFMATVVSMISSHLTPDVVTPSMVGLAINYTLLVPIYLNHVVKFLAEVEMFMNSVDRIDRFSKLETEDYGDGESDGATPPPPDWPTKGAVVYDNVYVRYSPTGPPIIRGLTTKIGSESKVGICGRSGSGKSSLLMALFRISDISEGKIEIDGIDVKKVPLLQLRSAIALIPQENILFSGSIRFNLDPHAKFEDADIWRALELSQMKYIIQDLPGQLDAEVKDGGAGFSAGQKQLLGLARAILHKTKLIIMDEATSSVDLATETTLLQVVSQVFKDSTVLTIAHRLSTITGGDRILVLDAGHIVEDGAPNELLARPHGIFAQMMKNTNE